MFGLLRPECSEPVPDGKDWVGVADQIGGPQHRLRDFAVYRLATGPAGQQIGTNEESVPKRLPVPPYDVGVIAGRRATNPVFARVMGAESDGKVTVESARLDGMRDLVVVDRAHTFLMWAPDVLTQAFTFLETGRFHR